MDYELPSEFDLIIIGTGMVESIVSAAASRIGKKVLHIDSKNCYGGLWASFNLEAIQKLCEEDKDPSSDVNNSILKEGEHALEVGNNRFNLANFSSDWHIPQKVELGNNVEANKDTKSAEDNNLVEGETLPTEIERHNESKEALETRDYVQEHLIKDSRKFNIDLAPKLQFARGDFVELLISSNIARYSEYKSVSRVLTWLNGQLEVVPCSRSDVFANNKVSVIEKRMLMKLFTSLDEVEKELADCENKTFHSFLKEKKLTANLIHYVLYAIAMSKDDTPCIEGVQSTKRFLNSLGRFGKTPFLFSMYGSGEIAQAFCRLSAVFGGIYALSQPLNGLIFDKENNFKALVCGKQRIDAANLVMSIERSPQVFVKSVETKFISRAIFITDKSVLEGEKEHLTLLLYPPQDGKNPVIIIEMGTLTGTCPKGLYLVHMISRQQTNPKEDVMHCTQNLFRPIENTGQEQGDNRPKVLWSCFFSIPDTNEADLRTNMPDNVFLCPGPDLDLDYDLSIKKAKAIFHSMYSDAEFLPRAPDPEEIVIEGYEEEGSEAKDQGDFKDNSSAEDSIVDGQKTDLTENAESKGDSENKTADDI